jgi:sterol 14-demethylase
MKMEGDYESTVQRFSRHLTYFLRTEMLRAKFPALVNDVRSTMESIKKDPRGLTDPFESIYGLVFRLLIRMVGADELLRDPGLANSILHFYDMMDESAGAAVVIFPKTPTLLWLKRAYAGARLYMYVPLFR